MLLVGVGEEVEGSWAAENKEFGTGGRLKEAKAEVWKIERCSTID